MSSTVKRIHLFSDGCRGQNLNQTMIRFLFTLVYSGKFERIDYHIPIRGHSFLPCDREFGVIEKMKRKKESVELYTEWRNMISTKFETVEVTTSFVKSFKDHFEPMFKKSVTAKKTKFKISQYKRFQFSAQHKLHVLACESMKGNAGEQFSLLKPNTTPNLEAKALYSGMVPVKKAKLDDVKSLYKYLSPTTIHYINSVWTAIMWMMTLVMKSKFCFTCYNRVY